MLLEVDHDVPLYRLLQTSTENIRQGKWVKNPPATAADCIFKIFVHK